MLAAPLLMSAFGGKADLNHDLAECPLIAISGHASMSTNVPFEVKRRDMKGMTQRAVWCGSQGHQHPLTRPVGRIGDVANVGAKPAAYSPKLCRGIIHGKKDGVAITKFAGIKFNAPHGFDNFSVFFNSVGHVHRALHPKVLFKSFCRHGKLVCMVIIDAINPGTISTDDMNVVFKFKRHFPVMLMKDFPIRYGCVSCRAQTSPLKAKVNLGRVILT